MGKVRLRWLKLCKVRLDWLGSSNSNIRDTKVLLASDWTSLLSRTPGCDCMTDLHVCMYDCLQLHLNESRLRTEVCSWTLLGQTRWFDCIQARLSYLFLVYRMLQSDFLRLKCFSLFNVWDLTFTIQANWISDTWIFGSEWFLSIEINSYFSFKEVNSKPTHLVVFQVQY